MKFDILDLESLEVKKIGEKNFYNLDNKISFLSNLKEKTEKSSHREIVNIYGWNSIKKEGNTKVDDNFLGYFVCEVNSVEGNATQTFIQSSASHRNRGVQINQINLIKVCSFFSAKKMIKSTWINQKDEYLIPNNNDDRLSFFEMDSIIYSIFNTSSYQSSLRQVEYKNKLWDIKNEFFWMSKDKIKEIADENGYDNIYNDSRLSEERYVYKLLFGEERIYDILSPDAKLVLDYATRLVEKSIQKRKTMANNENHLDSWDSGYAQLKLVWKEYFPEEFKEFRQLYKNLEDRMRPLVYELGFLNK